MLGAGANPRIQNQLDVLEKRVGFFSRTSTVEKVLALEEIAERGVATDINHILEYVTSSDAAIAKAAAKAVQVLITKNPEHNAWNQIYAYSSYFQSNIAKDIAKHKNRFTPKELAHIYGIAALSRNGYYRQDALLELAKRIFKMFSPRFCCPQKNCTQLRGSILRFGTESILPPHGTM